MGRRPGQGSADGAHTRQSGIHAEGPAAVALEQVLSAPRAVLVLGKGGVGKTTVAAALVDMSVARGVEARRVALGAGAGVEGAAAGVWQIDPDEAFERAAEPIFGSKTLVRAAFGHRAIRELVAVVPGLREYAMLVVALGLDGRKVAAERVVIDMPATGHGLAWMSAARHLARVAGTGRAFQQAQALERALRTPRETGLVLVTQCEPLIRAETLELQHSLQAALGRGPDLVVANRVPRPMATPAELAMLERAAATVEAPEVARELRRMFGWHMARARMAEDAAALGPEVARMWLDDGHSEMPTERGVVTGPKGATGTERLAISSDVQRLHVHADGVLGRMPKEAL